MNPSKPPLSREFVMRSILNLLEAAEAGREWGSVLITWQAGKVRWIKKEVTIVDEQARGKLKL